MLTAQALLQRFAYFSIIPSGKMTYRLLLGSFFYRIFAMTLFYNYINAIISLYAVSYGYIFHVKVCKDIF